MSRPHDRNSTVVSTSLLRQEFLKQIVRLSIKSTARAYYVNWAESWTKARGHQSTPRTLEWFEALTRSSSINDWQLRQAIDAARILACDAMKLPWALSFDWQGLSDQTKILQADHRTIARKTIRVSAQHASITPSSKDNPATQGKEIAAIIDALRRSIRLKNLAVATEETYVGWVSRFVRFCHQTLGQSPQTAGIPAVSGFLNYLALERNVSTATQKASTERFGILPKTHSRNARF